ncbi:hypothetical protein GGTG_00628 [Gaeumannomyces tritici R3-111a-1]|uniref:Uncharacterized protein n=1 Tax=Gaeumannomyces tritici (strain R3-111a-1) TaxID=644352 RepID=J3NH90_GAET3|nr:hypothetical protein GGTG_00628 [Gaeumannomyces tritici R3-111a-1]EJT80633.1 hypothetical protein GGTG_00628 [Gaeumannomyces tritici R3-111a-1]
MTGTARQGGDDGTMGKWTRGNDAHAVATNTERGGDREGAPGRRCCREQITALVFGHVGGVLALELSIELLSEALGSQKSVKSSRQRQGSQGHIPYLASIWGRDSNLWPWQPNAWASTAAPRQKQHTTVPTRVGISNWRLERRLT